MIVLETIFLDTRIKARNQKIFLMFRKRCFLPDPEQPGTLQLVTLQLQPNCAPIQTRCMEAALDKWQRLFVVKVLEYTLSDHGAIMLFYIPNCKLTKEQAQRRNEAFDAWLRERSKGTWKPRRHDFSPDELGSLSKFATLFNPDLRKAHEKIPPPEDLTKGYARFPVFKCRYKATTVQHTALPPVFTSVQLTRIGKKLIELGFHGRTQHCRLSNLYISSHGVGTHQFVADLEERCWRYLNQTGAAPKLWDRFGTKYIVLLDQAVWERRLKEIASREPYEDHPHMWNLLMNLDMLSDSLLRPELFLLDTPFSARYRDSAVTACLPFTLTILLADGLLRWYYRAKKDVEFPHYNFYRLLQPWEVPRR